MCGDVPWGHGGLISRPPKAGSIPVPATLSMWCGRKVRRRIVTANHGGSSPSATVFIKQAGSQVAQGIRLLTLSLRLEGMVLFYCHGLHQEMHALPPPTQRKIV